MRQRRLAGVPALCILRVNRFVTKSSGAPTDSPTGHEPALRSNRVVSALVSVAKQADRERADKSHCLENPARGAVPAMSPLSARIVWSRLSSPTPSTPTEIGPINPTHCLEYPRPRGGTIPLTPAAILMITQSKVGPERSPRPDHKQHRDHGNSNPHSQVRNLHPSVPTPDIGVGVVPWNPSRP